MGVVGPGRGQAQDAPSVPSELPEIATVEARIRALEPEKGATLDEAAKRDLEALKATRQALVKLTDLQAEMAALEQRIANAPAEIEDLQQALKGEASAAPDMTFDALEGLSARELDARLQDALSRLQAQQDRLSAVNTQLINTQTLPERAQQSIAKAMQTLESSRQALEGLAEEAADAPRRLERLVETRLADLTVRYHQRALNANARLRELAQLRQEQLNRQIARQETRLAMLQAVLDRQRRAQSEQVIEAASAGGPLVESEHPAVQQARQVNRELSLELLKATERANTLAREGLDVRRQLDRVRQLQRTLNEQIEAIRGSLLLSRILREQRRLLPQVEQRRNLQDDIADLRLKQFELGRQREALRDGTALAQRLEAAKAEPTPDLVAALERLFASRRELVDQVEQAYGEQLSAAIDLQLNQQQLLGLSRRLRGTLDEQLFWVANSRPLDLGWLRQVPTRLIETWRAGEQRAILPMQWPGPAALVGLLPMLLAIGLFLLRPPIKRHLVLLNDRIGHLKYDTQALTPLAIALNALLACPGPLLMASLGLALVVGGEGVMTRLGMALAQLALAWGSIAWARRLLVRDGVAMRHFLWPPAYASRLSWLLLGLGLSLVPVLMIASLARGGESTLAEHPLALLLMLAGLVGMAVIQSKLIAAHTPYFGILLLRLLVGLALAAVPLLLIGLIVLGYEYTALSLVSRYVITLYLLGIWIVVEASVVRGLAVAARRLAYRRALARRRAQRRDELESGMDVVEEPPLDMNQVNQQSLRLSRLILALGLVLLLYAVWADLLSVLGYLDSVAVWAGEGSGVGAEGGRDIATGVSVADVFIALATVALTMMLARNLPGLLEVMVLSRLALKQGSAYAITSLLSYAIAGSGLVMALGTLGVTWDKLQWLVAALGVGLGFGLQEIFANFISGLIILFERPVRIGDTITLGNLHGTVNRIRIRATTVTDFDRKEIIIPNKTFVTDQLINWSLSDTITRVVLTYGVAYGSDLALVHRLLREAAKANARVLTDPEPQVFFLKYGASSLEFELRIFVNSLLDRLHAADEINVDIASRFEAHGVEIAFNQLDVRLHDATGGPLDWAARPPARQARGGKKDAGKGDGKRDGEGGDESDGESDGLGGRARSEDD
nr:mechanosensitive channel MscK [Halomonas sp. YLGW01]